MATATEQAIQQIYIGLLGRSADPEGLAYWAAEIDGGILTLEQLRANIVNEQPEYAAGLGLLTRAQTVEALYQNLFERAADAEGLEYWVNGGGSTVNTDQLVLALINGAAAADTLVLDNKTTAAIYYTENTDQADFTTDAATASVEDVDNTSESVDASKAATDAGSQSAGETYTLTTGVDNVTGTSSNDTFNGLFDSATPANSTLTALDTLNGGAGTDTLAIDATANLTTVAGVVLSNIETINLRSVGTTNYDASTSHTGLTTLNSTLATSATLSAAATTDVNVSGATGAIDVAGGNNVTVTDATTATNIQVGESGAGTTNAAGTITVTDSNQAAGTIEVDGGTDVTVTASSTATSGAITLGANAVATGDVAVTQNITSDASAAITAGNVTVTGGSTIAVTANIANTATTGNGNNVTAGTYTVTASDTTTSVNITQNNTATDLDAVTTGATNESVVLTFGALAAGEAVLIGETGGATGGTDLTFVASKALTAAEVAAAVASLTDADTQAAGGVVANGYFTGALDAGWTSGAVSGSTVTFTATTTGDKTNLDVYTDADGTGAADNGAADDATFAAVVTAGSAGTTVAGQDVTATDGAVVVQDNATASVTTVTLDGFSGATLGTTGSLDALTDLSLKDGAGTTTLRTAQTSLNLTLDGMAAASAINLDHTAATVATLNLTTTGSASDVDFTAAAVTTANITAGADLDVSGGTFAAVTAATITGAGDVTLGDVSGTVETLTASAATGDISATVDGTMAVVTTGSGNDAITVDTAGISKAIDLGAGDDTLTLSAATATVPTASVAGGTGTDTVTMTSASAQSLDANTNFATAISGFERLTISDRIDVDTGVTIDMEALGFSYVTINGTDDTVDQGADTTDDGDTLTLNNLASGGTVVLANTQDSTGHANLTSAVVVAVKDAATGTSDVLNIGTSVSTADIDAGTLTAANVETINVTATDTNVDEDADGEEYEAGDRDLSTLDLNATSATSVVVDGNANLTLDMTGNTAVTSINASALTGNLTVTAFGTATVTGGAGNDVLTADGSGDTLLGGAGNDTLTGADLTTLTGGAGADTFVVNVPTNVNTYSTITDAASGDVIQLTAGETFVSSGITLAPTAVFQDFANAAVNQLATDDEDAAWFQFGGNTYIVINDDQNDAVDADFENGADAIVQLTGLVDLSTASYNQTDGTLEIA